MIQDKTKPLIYIVDDDDGMRRALSTLMSTVGYPVVAFARPNEFLTKYDPNQRGCVVLDVRMPEMSGLEVQQQLNKSGAMIPVILITGHGDIPMAVQAMKDGAFDFLQKPFRDQDLLDRIHGALKLDAESRKQTPVTIKSKRHCLHHEFRNRALLLSSARSPPPSQFIS